MQSELETQAVIGFTGMYTSYIQRGKQLQCQFLNPTIRYDITQTIKIFKRTQQLDLQLKMIQHLWQKTYMGFQADIIIWDFKERNITYRLKLHKVLILSLSFSHNELYLASLGGIDDKHVDNLRYQSREGIVWNSKSRPVNQVQFNNQSDEKDFSFKQLTNKIRSMMYTYIYIFNLLMYVLGMSNEPLFVLQSIEIIAIIEQRLSIYKILAPVKKLFSYGVNCFGLLENREINVEAVDGMIAKFSFKQYRLVAISELLGGVTSFRLQMLDSFFRRNNSKIYLLKILVTMKELMIQAFLTIILMYLLPNAKNRQKFLRIQVSNLEYWTVAFMNDGKSIVSGWSDRKIRVFIPQSGRLLNLINDTHIHGCTTLNCTLDCQRIISEGQVKVWEIEQTIEIFPRKTTRLRFHKTQFTNMERTYISFLMVL
ncbi:unnamed protein product (macronuclear) [Paramecium tetraurelia]|uniref:Uncharacterized protein n=1 Tax=Paramecium tetraurelia TaxID=5888 RepID=A0DRU7_PARTE|nr:uncharacterized protein GSPATT00039722001 [Paramecium tetraurelia]CAK85764.1 unnamed protein product [Paramecium tetraurelia]|eukprot:XP_001453161.1 hypothetical protein (macronuclear) [Paramecium tetraurelia strain d4-2]